MVERQWGELSLEPAVEEAVTCMTLSPRAVLSVGGQLMVLPALHAWLRSHYLLVVSRLRHVHCGHWPAALDR